MENEKDVKLTGKQKAFCREWVKDFNATQAAIRAGYSAKTANEQGAQNLAKLSIQEEIKSELKRKHLGPDETKSIISTIAKSNVNKYLKVVLVPETPTIKVPLSQVIAEIEEEIDFEDEYASLVSMTDKEASEHEAAQERRRKKIIRLQIELRRNPLAFRERAGEPVMVERTEFDMVALAKDKEAGIIKSYKMTKEGPQIEFCSVDAQLANLARINAMFKDNLDLTMEGNVSIDKWLSANSDPVSDEG